MVERVSVKGYKSLRDAEIGLQPLTVIFGPNASGKSNLFDALGLLSRMVTRPTLREAFQAHRGTPLEAFSFGPKGMDGLREDGRAELSIEVDVRLSNVAIQTVERQVRQMREGLPGTSGDGAKRRIPENYLQYSLRVEIDARYGHLRVLDERLAALAMNGERKLSRNAFIERVGDRLHLRMEGQAHPLYRDLGLDHTIVSTPLYAPHYPHIVAFREEVSRWRFYYLEPQRMREPSPIEEVDALSPDGHDLSAFYNTLQVKNPGQFRAVNHALNALLPSIDEFRVETTREGLLQLAIVENGIEHSSRVMSEGTLRILGLLAITNPLSAATVVGYEEPENGVHPRRLQLIARLLKDAPRDGHLQILANTHSPVLPQYFGDEELVHARREARNTRFVPFCELDGGFPGSLERRTRIEDSLDADDEASLLAVDEPCEETPFVHRMMRGDFDG